MKDFDAAYDAAIKFIADNIRQIVKEVCDAEDAGVIVPYLSKEGKLGELSVILACLDDATKGAEIEYLVVKECFKQLKAAATR